MKKKIKGWIDRYFVPTIVSVILSISLAYLCKIIFRNPIAMALGGTWGDNLGFYGLILFRDIKERKRKDQKVTILGLLKVLRNAVAEFGAGEYLDTFLIRPGLMYLIPKWVGNDMWGITIAKFVADITFFLPTIISFEIRKKVFKD